MFFWRDDSHVLNIHFIVFFFRKLVEFGHFHWLFCYFNSNIAWILVPDYLIILQLLIKMKVVENLTFFEIDWKHLRHFIILPFYINCFIC